MDRILESMVFHGSQAAKGLSERVRDDIVSLSVSGYRLGHDVDRTISAIRDAVELADPHLAEILAETQISAWVRSAYVTFRSMPDDALAELLRSRPPVSRPVASEIKRLRELFPMAADSAEWLATQGILTRGELEALNDGALRGAFTVAGQQTQETVARIRDILVDQITQGPSLQGFREAIQGDLQDTFLSDAHVETVFRTTVQTAFREGRRRAEEDPIVAKVFPYRAYYAVHDSRARPEHRALEKLGLNGTNVYRSDDPMWELFDPPWDFNCRCLAVNLTIRRAADAGVREARIWLESGEEPPKVWRLDKILFRPSGHFVAA
jgi:SPP1 gp7 family putative phage head morphogenesis protein